MTVISKRGFLTLATAALTIPNIAAGQALPTVRLLVLRRPAVLGSDNCNAPCIRGSVYDVSQEGLFSPDTWTNPLGKKPICDVIERPWAGNAPNVSAIPAGEYTARIRTEATKSWMTNENRRWRLQLNNVEGRSFIQFHYGEDEKWSEGCFIVGDHVVGSPNLNDLSGPYCRVENGEAAIARLRVVVTSSRVDSSQIRIAVSNRASLFADFAQGC